MIIGVATFSKSEYLFRVPERDLLVIGFLDTLWVVLEIRVRFRVLFVRVPYYIGAIVGSPVVPLLPFFC